MNRFISLNKGAMFGLDARIALAIFGALSVISGAALYSAIAASKTEQTRQTLEEIIKATEQYYLDTGKRLPQIFTSGLVYSSDLLENRESLVDWRGPYIAAEKLSSSAFKNGFSLSMGSTTHISVSILKSKSWSSGTTSQFCPSGDLYDCSEWITIHTASGTSEKDYLKSMFVNLDELVDDSDGSLAGKVRTTEYGDGTFYLRYKAISRKRTW